MVLRVLRVLRVPSLLKAPRVCLRRPVIRQTDMSKLEREEFKVLAVVRAQSRAHAPLPAPSARTHHTHDHPSAPRLVATGSMHRTMHVRVAPGSPRRANVVGCLRAVATSSVACARLHRRRLRARVPCRHDVRAAVLCLHARTIYRVYNSYNGCIPAIQEFRAKRVNPGLTAELFKLASAPHHKTSPNAPSTNAHGDVIDLGPGAGSISLRTRARMSARRTYALACLRGERRQVRRMALPPRPALARSDEVGCEDGGADVARSGDRGRDGGRAPARDDRGDAAAARA